MLSKTHLNKTSTELSLRLLKRIIFLQPWCLLTFQAHENGKIEGCLNWLQEHAMYSPNRFKIRFLEDLSLELFAKAQKNVSESSVINMLTTSAFDYEPKSRFEYFRACLIE